MNLIADYIKYVEETEPPYVYHRWIIISAIGALLGRNIWLPFGHFRQFPNMYIMLMGDPGARKSTAMKMARKLVRASGYDKYSFDRTTKEKFLLDLEGLDEQPELYNGHLDTTTIDNLWGRGESEPRECYIAPDEFIRFSGAANQDFYDLLGDFWDWDDQSEPFTSRLKNSKSVSIFQPTISLLGGTNLENFTRAFPPEIMTTGFLSRMVVVYGAATERKYYIPAEPDSQYTNEIVKQLQLIRGTVLGPAEVSECGKKLLKHLYENWQPLEDGRFKSYTMRRYTQLIKLSLIVAINHGRRVVEEDDLVEANTYLSAAERMMPKALGQFGRAKNADVANKIMDLLEAASEPLDARDLWIYVNTDLNNLSDLVTIITGLKESGKIQSITTGKKYGLLPKKSPMKDLEFVNWELLTREERDML